MQSMTGFGTNESSDDLYLVTTEIKSLNNKYLDIYLDIPGFLAFYEIVIRKMISEKIKRGRVTIKINILQKEPEMDIHLDLNLCQRYYESFQQVIDTLQLSGGVRLEHLLRMDGVMQIRENPDIEKIWLVVEKTVSNAIDNLLKNRELEGEATLTNILAILDGISTNLTEINLLAPKSLEEHLNKVKQKLAELIQEEGFDERRIVMEAGLMAAKSDINEEIERLSTHLVQFRKTCLEQDTIGKKLDFISQEMLREMNTIGSKASDLQITNLVIDMKNELEKIKEQIRNIE